MTSKKLELIQKGLNGEHVEHAQQHAGSLPNFIIIGAAKSATTTLTTILPEHPDIFISKPKEPKFFGRRYNKGWDWYASLFAKGKDVALRGEGSTMYASRLKGFRHTAELMHRHLPELKLIYIVRHPLDRIVSQWRHLRGRNPNTSNFNDLMSNQHTRRLVVGCSMYYQRLSKFRKFYPDTQIHCMTFEDLLTSPKQTLESTLRFLGATPDVTMMLDQNGRLPRENEAGAKGRGHVEKPLWNPELKAQVLQRIRPDAEKMLAHMGKSKSYWNL